MPSPAPRRAPARPGNHDAIAFYERRGWNRVGTASLLLDDGHSVLPVVLFVLPDSLE